MPGRSICQVWCPPFTHPLPVVTSTQTGGADALACSSAPIGPNREGVNRLERRPLPCHAAEQAGGRGGAMFVGGLGATAYGFLWALLASVSSLAAIRRPARFRGLIVLIGWALLFTLGPALTQMRGVGFLRTATFGYALLTIPAFIAVEAVHRWLKARS